MSGHDAWSRLLLDGDTGWHIRVGEYILDHGTVPQTDLFSFSKAGERWFAWEWGADVIYAILHRIWGLKGIVILAGVQVALYATIVMRYSVWRGANALVTLAVGLLAVGASSVHYLARPHLFTLILLPVSIWLLEADRARPTRAVWTLIPLAALWTNLHGGFLALIACAGMMMAGVAVEEWWRGTRDWRAVRRYALLTAGCFAATFVNPYGYHLHEHIAKYLSSDWIREVVQEFQSPSFRAENILHFEVLLLAGLIASASLLARKNVVSTLWVLFWAHQALGSVRHLTIYVTIAAPVVALELTLLWKQAAERLPKSSVTRILHDLGADMVRNFRWTSLWPAAMVAGLLVADLGIRWPQDFPALRFPVKMVNKHQDAIRAGRVLTTDQWADYLIYRFYPQQRVFFDGRSDFYGPGLGKQYVRVSSGAHDWKQILDRHSFDVALIPPDWSLASLLKQDSAWRLKEDDGKSLLFERTAKSTRTPTQKSDSSLMKVPDPTEVLRGDRKMKRRSRTPRTRTSEGLQTRKEARRAEGVAPAAEWRLPSGQPLTEYAMRNGFVAPRLLRKPVASAGFLEEPTRLDLPQERY